ncbi:TM2 domain-containing protein [Saccharothrix luteola]|uniref:TM2 domain-containing protein n=1 Tax=Saccharothrix luteola TaxID=2893018 RepID=UPI001E4F7152|nr:TM2 domain-containing protein [Saccharothrix luteola]MCC8248688.1 TM2 domain-containing protein [Saccharothrix luteola]
MTQPVGPPPMCGSCGAYLQPPSVNCAVCGATQWPSTQAPPPHPPAHPVPYGMPVRGVVTAKNPGVAVLLSLLWLGAGNLYAGQTVLGVILLLANFPLILLAMTVLGLIIAFPVWVVLVIVSIVLAMQGAKDFNRRNGIVVR